MSYSSLSILKRSIPNLRKCLNSTGRRFISVSVEKKIDVPWGHIAGKLWGNQSSPPVIALHGMFDNAASFDKLMPLLNLNQPVLALDIPGYGKSSNPPPGLSPNYLEILLWLRYLIKYHLKCEKVTLLGHSFGSNLSFAYSALYPDEVDKYVSIDCSRVNMSSKSEYLMDDFRTGYAGGRLKERGILKEGTYEEFLLKMISTRTEVGLPVTEEQCHLLLARDLEKIGGNHYRSLVDARPHLKYIGRPNLSFLEALSKRIKCQVLTIRATNGILVKKRLEIYNQHIENIKMNSPKVVAENVEGGHHVHLDNPRGVADLINDFIK